MTAVDAILRSDNLDEFIQNGKSYHSLPLEMEQGHKEYISGERPRIVHTHVKYKVLPKGGHCGIGEVSSIFTLSSRIVKKVKVQNTAKNV